MQTPDEQRATVDPLLVPEIVTLPAEVDISNAARYGRDLIDAFGSRARVVIADMSATEFCDSSGLRQLLIAGDEASRTGGELRVVVRSAAVLRTMHVSGIDTALLLYGSLAEALTGKPDLEPEHDRGE
jgi:anti-sigma B factor antagonist